MMLRDGGARPLSFAADGRSAPLVNSAATEWAGVPFELHSTQPTEEGQVISPLDGEQQLRVVVDGGFEGVMCSDGRERAFRTLPGSVSLHGGGTRGTVRVRGSARTLVVGLTPEWCARVGQVEFVAGAGIHRIAAHHETARFLALAMCQEVERGAHSGALFAQSLSVALLSYALGRLPAAELRVQGGLSDTQCRRLASYIDARLGEEVQLQELAALCGVGLRHFSTLFRRAFGVPPHRFVLQRRLQRGAELLSTSNLDLAQVAFAVGFSSQSHFTNAFRMHHGITPARYRKQQRPSVALRRH